MSFPSWEGPLEAQKNLVQAHPGFVKQGPTEAINHVVQKYRLHFANNQAEHTIGPETCGFDLLTLSMGRKERCGQWEGLETNHPLIVAQICLEVQNRFLLKLTNWFEFWGIWMNS